MPDPTIPFAEVTAWLARTRGLLRAMYPDPFRKYYHSAVLRATPPCAILVADLI